MLHLQHREMMVLGHPVLLDAQLGHLMVSHRGDITWDQLQAIKNEVWGKDARAIEIYPVQSDVVNSGNWRHLWRLGKHDFCPDLLHHDPKHIPGPDMLQHRHSEAWREAAEVWR